MRFGGRRGKGRRPRALPPPSSWWTLGQVAATAAMILSVTLLAFAVYVGFVSRLHHDRAQVTAYANFRVELALATAPTGQGQPADPGRPLALGTPVAVLAIPQLNLREVVFEGTTSAVLENGPGHLRDTPLPGQAGTSEIMGRMALYGGPFRDLGNLAPGDSFTVTTGQGTHTYRVLDVRRVGDAQPPPGPGAGRLVLATADGNPFVATGVLRVDADLTSPTQGRPPAVVRPAQLSAAEQVMASDDTAWLRLVATGLLLLLAVGFIAWARHFWGGRQAWLVGVPVLTFLGLAVADQAARLLPNLM